MRGKSGAYKPMNGTRATNDRWAKRTIGASNTGNRHRCGCGWSGSDYWEWVEHTETCRKAC